MAQQAGFQTCRVIELQNTLREHANTHSCVLMYFITIIIIIIIVVVLVVVIIFHQKNCVSVFSLQILWLSAMSEEELCCCFVEKVSPSNGQHGIISPDFEIIFYDIIHYICTIFAFPFLNVHETQVIFSCIIFIGDELILSCL